MKVWLSTPRAITIVCDMYWYLSLHHRSGELSKQPSLPPDVLDQIAAMQKAIDKLTADLASVMLPPLSVHG